jgi:hypothetical protein
MWARQEAAIEKSQNHFFKHLRFAGFRPEPGLAVFHSERGTFVFR